MITTTFKARLSTALLFMICGIVAFPMFWALSTSLRIEAEAVTFPPNLLPRTWTLEHYLAVFRNDTFPLELVNSLFYSTAATLLAILVSLPAAYAASRFDSPDRDRLMMLILATAMIPGVAILIPLYLLLDHSGLLNSRLAVIVISAAYFAPQSVWFMKNFIDTVPRELDEAAMIDGASTWTILHKVIFPLIRPGLAAIFVLGFIITWNDYIIVAVFYPDTLGRTLQVALVNQVFDSIGISWTYLMSFAIVSSIPVVLLFLLAQKWFVAGLTAGSVKG
ncbi:hypothetical protein AU467_33500 [Mesorhizobium loti]|uniref:Maltose/maltodextrin transport system permease protein MalG n=1 Tax=Rhizobium loti TaxID=381 RepID=A0A101KMF1_RHILI|nr:hypothetical protein AU467_33500 [Mesorhizobium loti]